MTVDNIVYKPNPEKIRIILADYPLRKVEFILGFVSAVMVRLKDGTLSNYSWGEIANDLGILKEVDAIIDAFDIPEDEFYKKYGRRMVKDKSKG